MRVFVRNYFWKCSEKVHLKINFVISDMEVFLVKLFVLNIQETTELLDLEEPQRHLFITHIYFFSTKTAGLA